MSKSNWHDVVKILRERLNTSIAVPSCGRWEVRAEDGTSRIDLELDAEVLDANIQSDGPASPTFLWVIAWWLSQLEGMSIQSRLRAIGRPKLTPALRRSAYLLHAYEDAFGEKFQVQLDPVLAWKWPETPVFNVEQGARDAAPTSGSGSEAWFEYRLCHNQEALAAFNEALPEEERVAGFNRQMPVGLFEGEVRSDEEHRWTPGGKSAIDMWALSESKRVMHLFELKVDGNAKVGIIPEALYYASLLSHVRDNDALAFDETKSQGLRAVREHKPRIVMWLVAPNFHPLVVGSGRSGERVSPLDALNRSLGAKSRAEFRILPYELDGTAGELRSWNWEQAWMRPR